MATCKQIALGVRVFEDDEFSYDTAIFSLYENSPDSECLDGLLEVEENLLTLTRNCKGKDYQAPSEDIQVPAGNELPVLEALLARIRFKRAILQTLCFTLGRVLPSAKKSVAQALAQLELCRQTVDLGSDVSDLFDPQLNRRVFCDAPPRNVTSITLSEAFNDLFHMLSQISEIVHLNATMPLPTVLSFLSNFSSSTHIPNLVTRSILSRIVMPNGRLFSKTLLADALRDSVSGIFAIDKFTKMKQAVEMQVAVFSQFSQQTFESLITLYGYNRARQRRMMFKTILEFDALQAKVEEIDIQLHQIAGFQQNGQDLISSGPFYLSSWLYRVKLDLLLETQFMGFELDVFSLYEYPVVFSYTDHIIDNIITEMERLKSFSNSPETKSIDQAKKKKIKERSKSDDDIPQMSEERKLWTAKQLIARTSCQICSLLVANGLIRTPDPEFYNPDVQFKYRFKTFNLLGSPQPISYEQIKAVLDVVNKTPLPDVLEFINMELDQAKGLLNSLGSKGARATVNLQEVEKLLSVVNVNMEHIEKVLKRIGKKHDAKLEAADQVFIKEEKGSKTPIELTLAKKPIWWLLPHPAFPIFGIQ
ncbi:N-alpha-acetyltransferase 35 NatC auxiliary subunit [Phlyctochytrium planicorne]|nr:N-alpha-acetyltransferase 35 NatC auxiliary subunit [Phlyctochytrium planicorne]